MTEPKVEWGKELVEQVKQLQETDRQLVDQIKDSTREMKDALADTNRKVETLSDKVKDYEPVRQKVEQLMAWFKVAIWLAGLGVTLILGGIGWSLSHTLALESDQKNLGQAVGELKTKTDNTPKQVSESLRPIIQEAVGKVRLEVPPPAKYRRESVNLALSIKDARRPTKDSLEFAIPLPRALGKEKAAGARALATFPPVHGDAAIGAVQLSATLDKEGRAVTLTIHARNLRAFEAMMRPGLPVEIILTIPE